MSAALRWARVNLFADAKDAVITVATSAFLAVALFRLVRFVVVTGRWEIVRVNLALYLYGRYPRDQLWRVVAAVVLVGFVGGMLAGIIARRRDTAARLAGEPTDERSVGERLVDLVVRTWPLLLLVVMLLALTASPGPTIVTVGVLATLALGRLLGAVWPRRLDPIVFVLPALLPFVLMPFLTSPLGWDNWGGIMLTMLIASVSMVACFPLGVLLALGRRSSLPAIRTLCVGFIEFFRGVPLVVLVLMSDQALGFFFPQTMLPGKVVRAIVVFTIFTAAYVAEIVRGGLQSVPRGQAEAAQALGMSPWRVTGWIVLPQALRNVIPALVGQFISLFKDTTLVFVIGLLDPLRVAEGVTKQAEFDLTYFAEALIFAGVLFWVGSYTMSRESQRLERRLGVGTR